MGNSRLLSKSRCLMIDQCMIAHVLLQEQQFGGSDADDFFNENCRPSLHGDVLLQRGGLETLLIFLFPRGHPHSTSAHVTGYLVYSTAGTVAASSAGCTYMKIEQIRFLVKIASSNGSSSVELVLSRATTTYPTLAKHCAFRP